MQVVRNTPIATPDTPSPPIQHEYQLALGTTMFVNLEGRGVVREVPSAPRID